MIDSSQDTSGLGPWGYVSVGVVALLGVGAVVLSILFLLGDNDSDAPHVVEGVSENTDDGECVTDVVDTDGPPLSAAPEVEWLPVGQVMVPHSEEGHGPNVRGPDDWRACFARTPEGALLAAETMAALASHPQYWDESMEYFVAEGDGLEAWRESATQPNLNARWEPAGFRYMEYDGDRAVIDQASRSTNGTVTSLMVVLEWEDDEWRLVLADDGTPLYDHYELSDLSDYVQWEAPAAAGSG